MDLFQEEDQAGTGLKIKGYWFCVFKAGVAESKVFSAGADTFRSTPKAVSQEGCIK